MPTREYFDKCPPFPSDVPVVALPKVSFQELLNNNVEETGRLYQACRDWGFFLLDLEGSKQGDVLLQDAITMLDLTTETFALDNSILEKFAFNPPADLIGYKQQGIQKTDDGKMDRMQLYSIKQDHMLGDSSTKKYAGPIEAGRSDIRKFMQHSHAVASVILTGLATQLGLQPDALCSRIPLEEVSETSLRILLAQSQPNPDYDSITLGGHTDIGVITLLFNVVGGLRILPARSENILANWQFVKPEPGCVIVNIGDTIVEWTGGVLRSGLHRVMTAPGEQASVPRQSLAYLLRPGASFSMKRIGGGKIPPVQEGDEEETRPVNEWASLRAKQILSGVLKPQTRGGS